jgi:hypothetical protein
MANPQMLGGYCRGQPYGSPLTTGKSPLKTRNKAKHAPPNHAGHGPRRGGPNGPARRPSRRSPRAGFASLENACLPRAGSVPFEGVRLPRAGSASLEGPLPPRAGSASLEGPLRPQTGSASLEGAPHAHACSHARAFNALTTAGRRHHAPGARAPVPPRQLPRRDPIPATVGGTVRRGRCQSRDTAPPAPVRLTRRALEGGGGGRTLDLLSCDLAGLGGGARPVGRHPCHC